VIGYFQFNLLCNVPDFRLQEMIELKIPSVIVGNLKAKKWLVALDKGVPSGYIQVKDSKF
jgi:hypothetical protein